MIRVASSELATVKTNRKLIKHHHSKTILLFKMNTVKFEFDRHLLQRTRTQNDQLPLFLVSEFGTFEIFMQK